MKPKILRLRNFKAVGSKAQNIELAPITLLFGPNSAGKSTVLQALIYLREVLVHGNYDPDTTTLGGDWLDLGGFKNLVHQRDHEKQAITIAVTFELEDDEELPDYLSQHEREGLEQASLDTASPFQPEEWLNPITEITVSISILWSEFSKAPFVETVEIGINGQRFARLVSTADQKQVYFDELNLSHPVIADYSDSDSESGPLSLHEQLDQLFQPSVSSLGEVPGEERPFLRSSLEELKEVIDEGTHREKPEFGKKLLAELQQRSSRRAAELSQVLENDITNTDQTSQEQVYIGVQGQADALPNPDAGIRLDSSIWRDKEDWLKQYEDDDESRSAKYAPTRLLGESLVSSLVAGSIDLLRNWVNDITYVGPLRDLPARNLQPQLTPDRSRWAKGLAAWELIQLVPDSAIKEINYWLGDGCLKTGYQLDIQRFREVPINQAALTLLDREMEMDDQLLLKEAIENLPVRTRASLTEEDTGLSVMPQDIGVGISQVLPVIVLTVTQQSGVIAIEQPELHIHPAIQVELADLFARYAIEHNKLLLLETHSEHLLLRLLRRIRETESQTEHKEPRLGLRKEDVSVQYVQATPEGSRFNQLRIDEDGDFLDEWPDGFFDERDEELF